VLGLSAKIYSKALSLAATLDPRVIFIILIIILNLSLAATPDPRALDVGLTIRSCHKSVITK